MNAIEELSKACSIAEASAMGLLKSSVKEYTRQDGTVVQAHEDSRHANLKSEKAQSMGGKDVIGRHKAHQEAVMAHLHAMRSAHSRGDAQTAQSHKKMAIQHIDESTKGFGDAHGDLMQAHGRMARATSKEATDINNGAKGGLRGTSSKAEDSQDAKSDYHEVARHASQKAADHAKSVDEQGGTIARMLQAYSVSKKHQAQADVHDSHVG